MNLRLRLGRVTEKPLAHYCVLENGSDLHVNERQTIQHYHASSTEERRRKKNAKSQFFTSRGVYIIGTIIAMLYTHSNCKSAVEHDGGI